MLFRPESGGFPLPWVLQSSEALGLAPVVLYTNGGLADGSGYPGAFPA